MNKLSSPVVQTTCGCYWGILETPMYPSAFYAGVIHPDGGRWTPGDNGTCYYHQTWAEARAALDKLLEGRGTTTKSGWRGSFVQSKAHASLEINVIWIVIKDYGDTFDAVCVRSDHQGKPGHPLLADSLIWQEKRNYYRIPCDVVPHVAGRVLGV